MRLSRPRVLVSGLAVAALLAASAVMTVGVANADSTQQDYKVWNWNVAGWTVNEGSVSNGLIGAVAKSIDDSDANFGALNELCRGQYNAIVEALRDANWPKDSDNFARFDETRSGGCDGEPSGNAILSRAPLGKASHDLLPDDGREEKRSLLCAPLANQEQTRFCTTHITTSDEVIDGEKINETQLNYVNERMDDFHAAGDSAMISGDFNAEPHQKRMNGWYSSKLDETNNPDNTGHYRELDDDDSENCIGYGEGTFDDADATDPCDSGKKIDMIFAHEDRLAKYSADALAIPDSCGGACSDHRILTGDVTLKAGE